ncbi:MAG: hypothetical protein DI537_20390 [Stutzerimonas stutzeri]|nr:MAG: hypothetical protein DI537_20390 [Stutzerimonas stutzeri]
MFGIRITRRNGTARPSYEGSIVGFCHKGDWSQIEPYVAETIAQAEAKAAEMQASADNNGSDCRYVVCPLPTVSPASLDVEPVPAEITEATVSFLRGVSCRRTYGRAMLQIVGDSFVMTGPSGRHVLSVSVTDLGRLNAHWRTFARNPLNRA